MKGILDQKIWARDPSERGKHKTKNQRPIEEKESYKWLESMDRSNKDIPQKLRLLMSAIEKLICLNSFIELLRRINFSL